MCCTVIEPLEGQPPYHTLKPMQASYRIAQNDCPPIPEGASHSKRLPLSLFSEEVQPPHICQEALMAPMDFLAKKQMADGKRTKGEARSKARARSVTITYKL